MRLHLVTRSIIQSLRQSTLAVIGSADAPALLITLQRISYFSDRVDIENLIRGVRATLAIARTSPLTEKLIFDYTKKNDDMNNMYWLADQHPDTLTDAKLEEWVKTNVETLYHPVNTVPDLPIVFDSLILDWMIFCMTRYAQPA